MSSRLLDHPAALCNIVRRIALQAGEITLDYFDEAGFTGADAKEDGSPVTIADHKAEEYICAALREALPDVPIVSEEAFARGDSPDCSEADYFWLVDALDGTRQFIDGSDEYTVNIALTHDCVPVLGVIYAPARGELYAAHGDGTAIRWLEDTGTEKPLRVRQPLRQGVTAMVSTTFAGAPALERYLEGFKVEKVIRRGSSLKLCAIAAGKADLYPRFGPSHEWDIAAGHAILLGAGGLITDMQGTPLTYGHRDRGYKNPDFVALTPSLLPPAE